MIDFLTEKRATYVTNAVTHARKLAVAGFRVILIGGEFKGMLIKKCTKCGKGKDY